MLKCISHAIIQTFTVLSNTIQNTTVKYQKKNVVPEWKKITLSSILHPLKTVSV